MNAKKTNSKQAILYFIGICTLLLSLNGCDSPSETLSINNPNQLSPATFWETPDDAHKAINAVYGPLTTWEGFGRNITGRLLIQRGDEVDPYPQPPVNDPGTFSVTSSDPAVANGWGALYRMVSRANRVLVRVPDIEMDQASKKQILGQAYFLRGLAYFYLLNMWGNIPYYSKPVNSLSDLESVTQAPQDSVWNHIISDFKKAQGMLPNTWPENDVGRASWGAATSMLGKSYLYTKDWSQAATELKKVMDSNLYELVDNYQWNFIESHQNNKESIFELQYERSNNGNLGPSGTKNPWRGQMWEPDVAPHGYTSQQSVDVNKWVFNLFMNQKTTTGNVDPRAYATMIWNYAGAKVYQDDFENAFNGTDTTKVWVRKYLNFDQQTSLIPGSWAYSNNNYRMIRLGGVLLMYAEAENEANGPSSNVYAAMDSVRSRADMPDIALGLDKTGMRQAIRKERVLELALEGNRFFDLKRWGIAYDRFNQNPDFRANSGGKLDDGEIYLPLPEHDVNANPDLKQNDAYR